MVQITSQGKIISTKDLPTLVYNIIDIEENKQRIRNYCKDIHVGHQLYEMVDKKDKRHFQSILGVQLPTRCEIDEVISIGKSLENNHKKLLDYIGTIVNESIENANITKTNISKSEDHLGMYWQGGNKFQKEQDKDSLGLCIISNYREDIIMSLEEKEITYEDAIKAQKDQDLPKPIELLIAFDQFKDILKLQTFENYFIDSSTVYSYVVTDVGYVAERSNGSDYSNGGVGYLYVYNYPDVRKDDYGSRLARCVKRIKK